MNKRISEPLFHIVKRDAPSLKRIFGVRVAAILLALLVCGIVTMATTGLEPISVYESIFTGAFGSKRKIWITLQNTAVLLLISVALTPAFRMRFWNVGGEGQILVGGLAAAACMTLL